MCPLVCDFTQCARYISLPGHLSKQRPPVEAEATCRSRGHLSKQRPPVGMTIPGSFNYEYVNYPMIRRPQVWMRVYTVSSVGMVTPWRASPSLCNIGIQLPLLDAVSIGDL